MLDAEGKVHILGRRSELINVGGEKVHPTEIENVLLQIDNVKDVTVRGHPNPITGEVVAAKISTVVPEDTEALKRRVR
jgi:acyl-CoA synthetase (AMP-forming)/AMP-acid ligase II